MNIEDIFNEMWEEDLQFKSCPEDMKESMKDAFIAGYVQGMDDSLHIFDVIEEDMNEAE